GTGCHEKLRKDSLAEPVIQSDNGSGFISKEFKSTLRANGLPHRRIRPRTPTDNAIVERANRTVREEIESGLVTDYAEAVSSIDRTVLWYNTGRRHSSLNYLMPKDYYRGDPDVLLAVREAKMEMAKSIRKENNIKNRNRGEVTGIVS
ncbi:Integrase, catalytic core domain protein, partial [mine drainage metagenome]